MHLKIKVFAAIVAVLIGLFHGSIQAKDRDTIRMVGTREALELLQPATARGVRDVTENAFGLDALALLGRPGDPVLDINRRRLFSALASQIEPANARSARKDSWWNTASSRSMKLVEMKPATVPSACPHRAAKTHDTGLKFPHAFEDAMEDDSAMLRPRTGRYRNSAVLMRTRWSFLRLCSPHPNDHEAGDIRNHRPNSRLQANVFRLMAD
ncbi:MAG: hypothetical protein AB1344_03745 [Pseudomonadota bacterium]